MLGVCLGILLVFLTSALKSAVLTGPVESVLDNLFFLATI